jgi:hypothetical protein
VAVAGLPRHEPIEEEFPPLARISSGDSVRLATLD